MADKKLVDTYILSKFKENLDNTPTKEITIKEGPNVEVIDVTSEMPDGAGYPATFDIKINRGHVPIINLDLTKTDHPLNFLTDTFKIRNIITDGWEPSDGLTVLITVKANTLGCVGWDGRFERKKVDGSNLFNDYFNIDCTKETDLMNNLGLTETIVKDCSFMLNSNSASRYSKANGNVHYYLTTYSAPENPTYAEFLEIYRGLNTGKYSAQLVYYKGIWYGGIKSFSDDQKRPLGALPKCLGIGNMGTYTDKDNKIKLLFNVMTLNNFGIDINDIMKNRPL